MATVDEKKRHGGSKVSAIANIFQSKPQLENLSHRTNVVLSDTMKDPPAPLKDSPTQVTVVRTESHVARFNNARALFEKLGEENKPNRPTDRVMKPTNLHGLRSRSSSANSGSGCTSPARSPRPRSPSPSGTRDLLSNWSASVPALNAERHFENGHNNHGPEGVVDRLRPRQAFGKFDKFEKSYGKENRMDERPEKPEKPERRLNSKELIEKQKNWTSHFSKTRPSRYNSDPNRSIVQTTLNQSSNRIGGDNSSPGQSPGLLNNEKDFRRNTDVTNNLATRSASFCSTRPPPNMSPPPPPPPARISSNNSNSSCITRKERPVSIASASPTTPEYLSSPKSPEYATVNKNFDTFSNMPEYAVVQKGQNSQASSKVSNAVNVVKKNQESSSLPEYAVVQKNLTGKNVNKNSIGFKNESIEVPKSSINFDNKNTNLENQSINVKTSSSSSSRTTQKNFNSNNFGSTESREFDESATTDYTNYQNCPLKSPAKTSEWKNEWLAKNDEILKNSNLDLNTSKENLADNNIKCTEKKIRSDSRPDWAKPNNVIDNVKRKENINGSKKLLDSSRSKSPESELLRPSSACTDSTSSGMSSPSSPSKDSKEEKADKEVLEKNQKGRNSYDLEIEDSDKPTIYTEKKSDNEFSPEKPFSETDTATVIRRSHVRVDLPAAGLGQRPPSVVSSDQEFPPLEHKDIPIPSPYAKRLQNAQLLESKAQNKQSSDTKRENIDTERNDDSFLDRNSIAKLQNLAHSIPNIQNQDLSFDLNSSNDQINFSKQETFAAKSGKEVSETVATSSFTDTTKSTISQQQHKIVNLEKSITSTNQSSCSSSSSTNQVDKNSSSNNDTKSMTDFINSATKNSFNEYEKSSATTTTTTTTANNTNITNTTKIKTEINALNNPNLDSSNKTLNKPQLENIGQLQTTWEQEKLKADQIAALKSANLSSKNNQYLLKSQIVGSSVDNYEEQQQHVSSSQNEIKSSSSNNDDKESENSIQEDSDSSDAKTVTHMESFSPSVNTRQNFNGQESTPSKQKHSQVPAVTPDTMTADEAENLLSSRSV